MAMARQQKWDAFIMDLNLPDQSGIDVLEELLCVDTDARVLVFSIHPESTHAVRLMRSGARGYLNKATMSDELILAIRTILDGRRYLSAESTEYLVKTMQEDPLTTPHELLSNREFQILQLLASGTSLKEIAGALCLSSSAVSTYRARILKKLRVKSNAELARYAFKESLIE
jgi:DNA-binding NarL/FixJ family response regulator